MNPLEAMDLLSRNIARLSGTREDHAILQQAEQVVRVAVMKSMGNVKAVGGGKKNKDAPTEKESNGPSGNA